MKYCIECGSDNVVHKVPDGDAKERIVCNDCGYIFYSNPKIVTGCILEWQTQILLCRRAIEPRVDFWTVPAGFMENGESVVEAAVREAEEEACARAVSLMPHSLHNLKHINQVYIIYRGTLKDGYCKAGHETHEVMLCDEQAVPWEELAFPVIKESLTLYFEDRRTGVYRYHQGDIFHNANGELQCASY